MGPDPVRRRGKDAIKLNNHDDNINILIVDDKRSNLLAMEALLEAPDRNILKADSGDQVLSVSMVHDFAVILLDVQMPGMNGIETARLLKQNNKTKNIPIIFVTAINKERHQVVEGYETGALDYIFKPFEPVILKSKVNCLIEMYREKRRLEIENIKLRHVANKSK